VPPMRDINFASSAVGARSVQGVLPENEAWGGGPELHAMSGHLEACRRQDHPFRFLERALP
jgi:hypothetical protein